MDGSYQSLEALPIEHLQIVFVASSSCSEDDTTTTTATSPSSATAPISPACQQQRLPAKKTLANGHPAQPRMHDVKAKVKKVSGKMAATKRVMGKTRERSKKADTEKKVGVQEEVLDAPPDGWPLRRVISIEEDHLPHLLQGGPQLLLHQLSEEEDEDDEEEVEDDVESGLVIADPSITLPPSRIPVLTDTQPVRKSRFSRAKKTPASPRGQPVGKEAQQVCPQL